MEERNTVQCAVSAVMELTAESEVGELSSSSMCAQNYRALLCTVPN